VIHRSRRALRLWFSAVMRTAATVPPAMGGSSNHSGVASFPVIGCLSPAVRVLGSDCFAGLVVEFGMVCSEGVFGAVAVLREVAAESDVVEVVEPRVYAR
jgi:hypothetical protein